MPGRTPLTNACGATLGGTTRRARCACICLSVGASNTSVAGSSTASPRRSASRLRSSTAPSESSPTSINGASADTEPISSDATSRTITAISSPQLALVTGECVSSTFLLRPCTRSARVASSVERLIVTAGIAWDLRVGAARNTYCNCN